MHPVHRRLQDSGRAHGPMRWPSWRSWALPMGVVLLGCVLTVALAPAPAPDNGDPSSYATGRAGTWALFQLASRLGAEAERLTGGGFGAALSPAGTLVEVAPTTPFSKLQLRQIQRFLEAGGTLVYALGSRSVDAPVLASLHVATGRAAAAGVSRELLPLRGSTLLTVQFGSGPSLSPAGPQAFPLLGSATRPVALVERVGLGRAVLLNSGAPVANTDLREQQNAEFAVSALGLVAGRPILFDEIHHGYTLGDGAAALLLGTPWGWSPLSAPFSCSPSSSPVVAGWALLYHRERWFRCAARPIIWTPWRSCTSGPGTEGRLRLDTSSSSAPPLAPFNPTDHLANSLQPACSPALRPSVKNLNLLSEGQMHQADLCHWLRRQISWNGSSKVPTPAPRRRR